MRTPGNTRISITLARKISTPTDSGRTRRTTVKCGFRMNPRAGLPTAMATGFGSPTTAGRGWVMSHGAGLLITMDAGCGTAARGHGGLVRCGARASTVHSGRRLMYLSLDSEADSALASVSDGEDGAVLAGCRLVPAIASFHGGGDRVAGTALWASIVSEVSAGLVESRHCMAAVGSPT